MARPLSKGLKYFNLDVSFFQDRKVRRLQRKCGEAAPLVYLCLLCTIYEGGYYIKWDEDLLFDLADLLKIEEKYVQEVIDCCFDTELLSRELFEEHRILTSEAIQKRYQTICEQSKRLNRVSEFSLLVSPEETSREGVTETHSSEETSRGNGLKSDSSEFGTQSKVKKSKVKESKENYYYSFEEEKEEILSFCFFKNWAAPSKEYSKIIAYNNTGGRSWDSMTRTQKESALALWKQQPEQHPRFSAAFLEFWENIYTNLRSLNAPFEVRMDALSDSIAGTMHGNTLCLHCTDRLRLFIERHLDVFKPIIRAYQSRFGLTQLNYSITNHDNTDRKGLAQDPDAPA